MLGLTDDEAFLKSLSEMDGGFKILDLSDNLNKSAASIYKFTNAMWSTFSIADVEN